MAEGTVNASALNSNSQEKIDAIYDIVTRNAGFELIEQRYQTRTGANSGSRTFSFSLHKEEEYVVVSAIYLGSDRSTNYEISSSNENTIIEDILPLYKDNSTNYLIGFYKITGNIGDTITMNIYSSNFAWLVTRFHIIYS